MKPKTKTILFILLSFVLGIVCGLFIDGKAVQQLLHQQGKRPANFQKMLTERLKLDEHQAVQLDSLLESRRNKMETRRKHMIAMRDTMQMEIRKILNPEQVKIFDELNQKMNMRGANKWERDTIEK